MNADLCERLKLEAQMHAQEARTANATIAEIYQLVTGATGEPGNWNGAAPVRALVAEAARLRTANAVLVDALTHAVEIAENKRTGTWDDLLQYRATLTASEQS